MKVRFHIQQKRYGECEILVATVNYKFGNRFEMRLQNQIWTIKSQIIDILLYLFDCALQCVPLAILVVGFALIFFGFSMHILLVGVLELGLV